MVLRLGLLLRCGLLAGLAALTAGCLDDAEAGRGRGMRRYAEKAAGGSPDAGAVDSGTDIFERHDFDVCYSTHQISGANWPSAPVDAARALTAVGGNATTGVSTDGLSDTGLGAARVDQAATVADGNNGYAVASGWIVSDAEWIWKRYVFRRDAASVSADYLDRYSGVVTTNAFGLRFTGTGGTTRHNEIVITGNTTFSPAYTATEDVWQLSDIVHCATCGPAGVARRVHYLNGSLVATTDHTEDMTLASLTGAYGVFGTQGGTNSPQYVTLVAVCWKFGAGNMITLEQHEIDTADLGL